MQYFITSLSLLLLVLPSIYVLIISVIFDDVEFIEVTRTSCAIIIWMYFLIYSWSETMCEGVVIHLVYICWCSLNSLDLSIGG